MSNIVAGLVERRIMGSPTRKAVMNYFAIRASDDGSGIWTSKAHIAADTEYSKRAIQKTINEFEAEGLVREVGKKKHQNGFTYIYDIDVDKVARLPNTRFEKADLTGERGAPHEGAGVNVVHPAGERGAPQDVNVVHPNSPLIAHKPPIPPNPQGGGLFPEIKDDQVSDQPSSYEIMIEEGFEEWWDDIWPKHPRKAGKEDCRKLYRKTCMGKFEKAEQLAPTQLNRATKAYIASVTDIQYLKAPLAWLRKPGWEPFMDMALPEENLTDEQKRYRRIADEAKADKEVA